MSLGEISDLLKVVLWETNISDLVKLSSVNQLSRNICSQPTFWREKFSKDGLCLMTQQTSVVTWVMEYRWTSRAKQKSETVVKSSPNPHRYHSFLLSSLADPGILDLAIVPLEEIFRLCYWYKLKPDRELNYVSLVHENKSWILYLGLPINGICPTHYLSDIQAMTLFFRLAYYSIVVQRH